MLYGYFLLRDFGTRYCHMKDYCDFYITHFCTFKTRVAYNYTEFKTLTNIEKCLSHNTTG